MFFYDRTNSQLLSLATLPAWCATGRMEGPFVSSELLWAPPIVRPRHPPVSSDDVLAEIGARGNRFVLLGLGNFWSAEQTLEQHAPGVVEAVSGYAEPTTENADQKEVVLVEYDPEKTTYELLVKYAYHNTDPFENEGQFCDTGTSYLPAMYYSTDEEFIVAKTVLAEVFDLNPELSEEDIAVPLRNMPAFRKAKSQDQDFYIHHPELYAHYKTNCGRSQRLKEVWGDEVYDCYHDETHSCFVPGGIMIASVTTDGMIATAIADGGNATDDALLLSGKILNSYGDVVAAESNTKSASDGGNP